MQNLKDQYRDLERKVHAELRNLINGSTKISKHTGGKSIEVGVFGYEELTIVNDNLTFLDESGQHYSLYADCYLEDLIDILSSGED